MSTPPASASAIDHDADPSDAVPAAADLFLAVASRITADQYTNPTPCDEWDVRGVLNAVAVKADLFTRAPSEPAEHKPEPWPDHLGDDPLGILRGALDRLVATYAQPDVDRTVTLPVGEVRWIDAQRIVILDLTLHAWDLATASSQDLHAPNDVLTQCLIAATTIVNDATRDDGGFKPALEYGGEATSLEQLLALCGRGS